MQAFAFANYDANRSPVPKEDNNRTINDCAADALPYGAVAYMLETLYRESNVLEVEKGEGDF